jgi:hypothetical protein
MEDENDSAHRERRCASIDDLTRCAKLIQHILSRQRFASTTARTAGSCFPSVMLPIESGSATAIHSCEILSIPDLLRMNQHDPEAPHDPAPNRKRHFVIGLVRNADRHRPREFSPWSNALDAI